MRTEYFENEIKLNRGALPAKMLFLAALLAAGMFLTVPVSAAVTLNWTSTEVNVTYSVGWGDYDGDGRLDAVMGNFGEVTRVYRNTAAAAFSLVWSSTSTDNTCAVVWGDYDGDGAMDLLFANSGQASVIYRQTSAANFSSAWTTPASYQTRTARWGDVDNDGDLDVVLGNYGEQDVIYSNNGSGNFSLLWTAPGAAQTRAVDLADFDNDGDLDIAAAGYSQSKDIFRNNGSGSFSLVWSSVALEATTAAAWGDYDGDSYPDLLVGNSGVAGRVYRNQGDETFAAVWTTPASYNTTSAAWGDLDNDGTPDIVMGNYGEANRSFLNAGAGSFTADWASAETDSTNAVSLADDDNDGDLDILAGNDALSGMQVYLNAPATANTPPAAPVITNERDWSPGNIELKWSAALDTQTTDADLITYDLRVGTSSGGCEVFCGAFGSGKGAGNGNTGRGLSHTLNLAATVTYYWSVRSVDTAHARSSWSSEDTFLLDSSNPSSVSVVNDGTASDITGTTSVTTLSANWSAAADAESGITRYWYSIGTVSGASNTVSWTDNGTTTSVTRAGLTLTPGDVYYFSVVPENGSGLMGAIISSDGQYSDPTPPSDISTINDGTGADITYSVSSTDISANWSASADLQSGVPHYRYSIGTTSGASDTVSWTDNATATAFTETGLTLADGQAYYVSVLAENGSYLRSSTITTNGQIVDTSKPDITGKVVNDGPGADIAYATTTIQLSANWTTFTDPHSGIKKYWYAIGTATGATDITGGWINNNLLTSVTRTGLSLSEGQDYYFTVRAENNAGLLSDLVSSDGQTVDISSPDTTSAVVRDGVGADTNFTSNSTQLSANWSGFADSVSGIATYLYAIGTTQGGTDIVNWTDNGTTASVTRAGLSLTDGATYFVSVYAVNGAGLESAVISSDGQTVGDSAPSAPASVNDGAGADIDFASSTTAVAANWTASTSSSGILRYWYAIGTTPGATDTVDWTDNATETYVLHSTTYTNGQIYYFSVKAENYTALESPVTTSDGVTIDNTAPADIASVIDGSVASDITYTRTKFEMSASWTASSDAESGVAGYWYAIGATPGATDTVDWTDNALAVSVTRYGLALSDGQWYYVSVKAVNVAGIESGVTTSSGQYVDTIVPDTVTVSDGAGTDIIYNTSNTSISANWTASVDNHSGLKRYWYSIGSTAGASDTVAWTDNSLLTSVTHTGLSLTDGQLYYFSVKAEDMSGNMSYISQSDGQMVDGSPPGAPAAVYDGISGADLLFGYYTDIIEAHWDGSADPHSGVIDYWYSVGTTAGASDTIAWTNAGNVTSISHPGLSLIATQSYYVSVMAHNDANLFSAVTTSDGQSPDPVPPTPITYVNDGPANDMDYTVSEDTLYANWSEVTDAHSGVARYWYCAGTSPGGSNIVPWTDISLATSVTVTGLSLPDGVSYYFTVKAEDYSGKQTDTMTSDGILKDSSPPSDPDHVYDGTAADITYTFSPDTLDANWGISSDPHAAIASYYYSVGTSAGASDTVQWTPVPGTSISASGLSLQLGVTYYFNVKAVAITGLETNVISSNGVTYNVALPVAVITSPAENGIVTGATPVIITATDESMQDWNLSYGPGAAPAAWDTLAEGTTSVTDQAVTWDTSLLSGAYSLRLTVNDTMTSTTVDYTIVSVVNTTEVAPQTTQAGVWSMSGMNVQPPASDPLSVFGQGKEFKVLRWDPRVADDEYLQKYRPPAEINAGYAFWFQAYDDSTYQVEGSQVDTTMPYNVPVYDGWNQICAPYNRAYPWSAVQVLANGNTYTIANAAALGIISSTVYSYDFSSNSYNQYNFTTSTTPGQGYFLRAYSDAELIFDPGGGKTSGIARIVRSDYDFKVKISAFAPESADYDNFIGESNASSMEFDNLDTQEPPVSPAEKFTALYFPAEHWASRPGRYSGDFRPRAEESSWAFVVETNEAGRAITLRWDSSSLPSGRYSFMLSDPVSGVQTDMTARDEYSYTAADGVSERQFEVLVRRTGTDDVKRSLSLNPGWNLVSFPIDLSSTVVSKQLGDDPSVEDFFQFFEGIYYPGELADIQSGLGYWIYSPEGGSVDVTGSLNDPGAEIRVPLKKGWNLVGDPFEEQLPWGDNISVVSGSSEIFTLDEAISRRLVSPRIYYYDGSNYRAIGPGDSLSPWAGFMVEAAGDVTLVLRMQ